jgi:hypothetical protein
MGITEGLVDLHLLKTGFLQQQCEFRAPKKFELSLFLELQEEGC